MISQRASKHITEYVALKKYIKYDIYHQNVVIFSATIIYFFENVANHK